MQINESPLVSFCIVAYNAEKYVEEAINAAFAQDYPNMEIIMSDDCSSDCTYEIMQKKALFYNGPHKIILNRNEPNIGPRENYNKVMYELSHGEFVFFADGDDISRKDRVSECVKLMMAHPDVMSMSVVSRRIDENGKVLPIPSWDKISVGKYSILTLADYCNYEFYVLSGDSRVLRRRLIDAFPPLQYSYSEDSFLFFRSFLLGSIAYLREPLVYYRQHNESIMGKFRNTKKWTRADIERFMQTDDKQFWTDYEYALQKGYISSDEAEFVKDKLKRLSHSLCPQRRTIWWRICHRSYKITNKFFKKLLKKLE